MTQHSLERPRKRLKPSSSSDGFFQSMPKLENQYLEDSALRRVSELFLPPDLHSSVERPFTKFGDLVISAPIFRLVANAERDEPYLRTWNSFGQRVDELVTSEGWRKLQEIGIREGGIMATGYERVGQEGNVVPAIATSHADEQRYSRVCQFLKFHLWTGSCVEVTCPSAMQDGAARLLANQLRRDHESESQLLTDGERVAFSTAYENLTSRDPTKCWTSGQWMTERSGGSDVRATETIATQTDDQDGSMTDVDGRPLGPWRIDGFKWFSSATDSNMAILLAKTEDGTISTFFAPTRRINPKQQTELNGIQLQRLKSKLGTHPLPTAEIVLSGMRAWRIGQAGSGTREISAVLNITRIYTAMSAVGAWGRGLAVSRAFARSRKVAGGRRLRDVEAHVRTMAENHVKYRARMMLAFFAASLMGTVEYPSASQSGPTITSPRQRDAVHLFRLMTPLAKAVCSKEAVSGLQECMESMGGIGYLENEDQEINIARLFRDANVNPIWEGTTDVLGTDIVRVLKQGATAAPTTSTSAAGEGADFNTREAIGRWMEGLSTTSEFTSRFRHSSSGPAVRGEAPDPPGLAAFGAWVATALCTWQKDTAAAIPRSAEVTTRIGKTTRALLDKIRACSHEQLSYEAREVMWRLTWIVCSVLLVEDARRDGEEVAWEVAQRWIFEHSHKRDRMDGFERVDADWRERSRWDRRIVFDAGDRMGLESDRARL